MMWWSWCELNLALISFFFALLDRSGSDTEPKFYYGFGLYTFQWNLELKNYKTRGWSPQFILVYLGHSRGVVERGMSHQGCKWGRMSNLGDNESQGRGGQEDEQSERLLNFLAPDLTNFTMLWETYCLPLLSLSLLLLIEEWNAI